LNSHPLMTDAHMPTENAFYPAAAPMDAGLFTKMIESFNGWAPYGEGETPDPAHYVGFAEFAGIPMEELAGYLSGERAIPQPVALLAAATYRLVVNGLGEVEMGHLTATPVLGDLEYDRGLDGVALRATLASGPGTDCYDPAVGYVFDLARRDQLALGLGRHLQIVIVGHDVVIKYVHDDVSKRLNLQGAKALFEREPCRRALEAISGQVRGDILRQRAA
jgi:hypothetical protein